MQISRTFSAFTSALCVFLLLHAQPMPAQDLSRPVGGKEISMRHFGQVIDIRATEGTAEIVIYAPSIIRIALSDTGFIPYFSYAVSSFPVKTNYTVSENDSLIDIGTDSMVVMIRKADMHFAFYTPSMQLINTDDALGTRRAGYEMTDYKKLLPGERFLGLGEKTGNLDRRGSGYTNWNTDCFGYTIHSDPMYISIPFYIGIHDSLCYGIFLDNSSRTEFNFGASNTRFASFGISDGAMVYYFIYNSNIRGIIRSYTSLTGTMPLPPLWSLGFQQSRWSYFPDTEVLHIANTFREKKIPLDGMYLDIGYMYQYRDFTWDPQGFPDPAKTLSTLHNMGIHTTVILDPGIAQNTDYDVYNNGLMQDVFLKYPDSTLYTADVWPGVCVFPDFTDNAVRKWWGAQMNGYIKKGVDGFWNDMNEPSTWGQKMPSDVLFHFDGKGANTLQAKNVYGMMMAEATYRGAGTQMSGLRPFILSRSGFAGIQRYAAVWTGDNTSNDEQMLLGVRLVNSLGISGVSFAGFDVGGFDGEATPALYARWISLGAFTPFFRAHKTTDAKEAEPWSFGAQTEEIARQYIGLRYRLMPYIYSAFFESTQDGMPVSRTLAIDHPYDAQIYDTRFQNEYMFGDAFLVAPVRSDSSLAEVYFPEGSWYDLYTDSLFQGNTRHIAQAPLWRLPVFVREGSIIPMQRTVQNTGEDPGDTLTIHIYYGKEGSRYVYYEDDGMTFRFTNQTYFLRVITFDPSQRSISFSAAGGNFNSRFPVLKIVLHGFGDTKRLSVNKKRVTTQKEMLSLMDDDSQLEGAVNARCTVESFVIPNVRDAFSITW